MSEEFLLLIEQLAAFAVSHRAVHRLETRMGVTSMVSPLRLSLVDDGTVTFPLRTPSILP